MYYTAPCKNCSKREPGCHAVCKDYIEYKHTRTAIIDKRYKENLAIRCKKYRR